MNCGQNIFSIFLGNVKTMSLKALYASNLNPLDLTSCTEIDIALPNADGTFSHLTIGTGEVVIISPPVLGQFTASVSAIVSALLQVGELQSFDVTFTISGNPITIRYSNSLSVFQAG